MKADLLSNDRKLLREFRRGEQEALMLVWREYFPLVEGLARRGFGPYRGFASVTDREEAVSASFAAAFEERCRMGYDGLTPYGSYLLGVSRNVMRRSMKKVAREPVREPSSYEFEAAPEQTPEEQVISAEVKEILSRFPATLQPDEQDVFRGYYAQGLSEEKLAEHLGRTRYRVRKAMRRVERKFRKYLRVHGLG